MVIDVEQGLLISRRALVKLGSFGKSEAADAVYSFCLYHMFNSAVEVPKELIPALTQLGVDIHDT